MMARHSILLALVLVAGEPARSATTQHWELASYADFLPGSFKGLALDRSGALRVAPPFSAVDESGQAVVWSVAAAEDGTAYYGTGHQGSVFRVPPGGEGDLLWKAPEIEVFALAIGPDGSLYAGTSPSGKVYKISPDGDAVEYFDPGEQYIWSLAFDSDGQLVVGTGGGGKLYRVTAEGNGELWVETGQRHVMSLAAGPDGAILAGTDPDGILYRIASDGTLFALFDSDLPEIRSVSVSSDGDVYVAAMGGGMDRIVQAVQAVARATPVAGAVAIASQAVQVATPQTTASVTYGQPQVVYAGERSALMRISDGKAVEKLWASNEQQILALALHPGSGSVLFATDQAGRIYQTDTDRRHSLVTQTGQSQLTTLVSLDDGILAAAGNGGALFRLGLERAPSGTYETAPRDTGGTSEWGRLTWRAAVPEGASVEIRTRSGNTHRPGSGWSGWSEPLAEAEGSVIQSPPARFIQWQATLRGDATLDRVTAHYLPQNSPPVVRSVNVVPESASAKDSSNSGSSNTNSYSITVSASGESSQPKATSSPATPTTVRKLTVVWGAEDPDGDKLRAEVAFRGEGESVWKTIRKDLPGPKFSIDSDALADGRYEFRVRVDDGLANTSERALSAERVSRPVLVDQTPPIITRLESETEDAVRFRADDAASEVRSAEYSIDAGEWRPVLSDDGVLDAPAEEFTVRLDSLDSGEHLVVLRVRDRAGNTALAKALVVRTDQ